MRRGRRVDPSSFDLRHACPACGYKIPPNELLHVDGDNIRCPKCGVETKYITGKPPSTS
jgi:DNA-directed RNA polymerase subunit RPC12/RpoP